MKKFRLLAVPVVASAVLCSSVVAVGATEVEGSPVVVNEVESNGDPIGDFVELANKDTNNAVDISGWSLVDDKGKNPIVLPKGTEIESGGYYVIYTDAVDHASTSNTYGGVDHFGLGKDDSVTLSDATGTVVDSYSWKELGKHAEYTYGRIPDMVGQFAETGASTPGARNTAGAGDEEPGPVPNAQLPFHDVDIKSVDLGGDFAGEDMSGVDFDAQGNAWIANNDKGHIYRLNHDAATDPYTLAGQWATGYPEGGGAPDAEGIVAARNGDIYLATEHNNENKKASRPSILRFANPTDKEGTQNAQQEWDLSQFTGEIQPNGGLEALAQLEDNVFAAGVEETGDILVVDLSEDQPKLLDRYTSPFEGVMALDYNAESKQLSVLCDEVCGGASQVLNWDGERLSASDGKIYERPENMGNFANEGFASHTSQLECEAGGTVPVTSYLWADDAATDGVSLRSAQVRHGDCESDQTGSSHGSSSTDFSAGGIVGALVAALAGVGLVGAFGAILPQLLKAFPALKAFFRL